MCRDCINSINVLTLLNLLIQWDAFWALQSGTYTVINIHYKIIQLSCCLVPCYNNQLIFSLSTRLLHYQLRPSQIVETFCVPVLQSLITQKGSIVKLVRDGFKESKIQDGRKNLGCQIKTLALVNVQITCQLWGLILLYGSFRWVVYSVFSKAPFWPIVFGYRTRYPGNGQPKPNWFRLTEENLGGPDIYIHMFVC